MELKVFVIFFTAFLQQVVFFKGNAFLINPKFVDEYVPDVKEIRNMTGVVLGPLLFMQSYFTFNNNKAYTCCAIEIESYNFLTKTLAASLYKEALKIQNQKQGKHIHDLLQALVKTLSQLGPYFEAIIKKKHSDAAAIYIEAIKEKMKKQFDEFLLCFYKIKLNESNFFKEVDKKIQDAYYKAERKSNEIVSALTKCMKG